MSDLPPIITAEAAVKSKRPGFVSIFDPQTDVTKDQDIKQFYADPQLIKEAVTELKKAGFQVLSTDRISVTISGPVELFEQQFNVTIISTDQGLTCEGVPVIGYINTDRSAFSTLLAGIALPQEKMMPGNGAKPPEKTGGHQLYPWEVPLDLGLEKNPIEQLTRRLAKVSRQKVIVSVVDSGFDRNHPFFTENNNKELGNVDLRIFNAYTTPRELKKRIETLIGMLSEALKIMELSQARTNPVEELDERRIQLIDNLLGRLGHSLPNKTRETLSSNPSLETLISFLTFQVKYESESLNREMIALLKSDYSGHGTQVVSLLLALIKNTGAMLGVFKTQESIYKLNANYLALKNNPDIFTCSIGSIISKSESMDQFMLRNILNRKNYARMKNAADEGCTIIFLAGNIDETKSAEMYVEPQWPFVISVGGAYRGDQPGEILASDLTQGYPTKEGYVPDICGLVGPQKTPPMHVLPTPPDIWKVVDGSSYAAPQIAGICVLIKMVYPAASWKEMKYILTRTCDEINTDSVSADGVDLRRLKTKFPDGAVKGIGLANISQALKLAISRANEAVTTSSKKATLRK